MGCRWRIGTIDGANAGIDAVIETVVVGTSARACATSISWSIWLWVAIDAWSFKGQLRLVLVWPCVWHAEQTGGCFTGCSSPIERIRPVRCTRKLEASIPVPAGLYRVKKWLEYTLTVPIPVLMEV